MTEAIPRGHGQVLCTGCRSVLGQRCSCHAGIVGQRVSSCDGCRLSQAELAELATQAAAAIKAGKPIPKRIQTPEEGARDAQRAFDDFDELERRYP